MRKILLVLMVVLIAGCESGYQRYKRGAGYSEFVVSPGVYSVSYQGNSNMTRHMVDKFLLRRCCELALANGYGYFEVASSKDASKTDEVHVPGVRVSGAYYWGRPGYHYNYPYYYGHSYYDSFDRVRKYEMPGAIVTIICYEDKPEGVDDAIDAQFYLDENFPELEEE